MRSETITQATSSATDETTQRSEMTAEFAPRALHALIKNPPRAGLARCLWRSLHAI